MSCSVPMLLTFRHSRVPMTTEPERELKAAREEAERQLRHATEQEPLIRAEAQAVRWLLQQNNLAARFRAALGGGGNG